jgi:DNA-binding XRE family transcriptional regulator
MKMREFIETGEKKAGTQKKLAEILNTRYTTLGLVKNGKKSLTTAICIKLARYIKVDELEVIAASNLIIEKDEERRKIFESCLKKTSKAAGVTAAAIVISILTLAPITPTGAALNGKINNNIHY